METFIEYKEKYQSREITQDIMESSLSRVYDHTKNRAIGIMSACRATGIPPSNANRDNTAKLKQLIRNSGKFGYITVKGRYVENKGEENEKAVDELSFLIIAEPEREDDLKQFLLSMGQKFEQDSVLFKPADSENAMLIGTNNSDFIKKGATLSLGKWHPNKAAEFMTMMKKGGSSFVFGESYELTGYFTGGDSYFSRVEYLF